MMILWCHGLVSYITGLACFAGDADGITEISRNTKGDLGNDSKSPAGRSAVVRGHLPYSQLQRSREDRKWLMLGGESG